MIKGIAHVCTYSTDLVATERFYCSGLRFKKLFDFVKGGQVIGFYLEVAKGSYVEVFCTDKIDPNAKSPMAHICFEVDDIDEIGRHLKSQGYEVTKKILGSDQSWQIWTADPSGVKIEFHQYTPKSSQFTGKTCILN
jgi:catechol 2,3-dioxygenase-like lactoylglutathione lyase family enzyme